VGFVLFRRSIRVLTLYGILIIGGCSSSSSPTDTTSTETCFDVTILSSGSSNTSSLCVTDENNRVNGLGVYRFIRFNVPSTQSMTFSATRTSGLEPADPDIQIFKNGTLQVISQSTVSNTESVTQVLSAGDYVLQLYEDKYTLDSAKLSQPASQKNISDVAFKTNQPTSFFAPSVACTPGAVTVSGVMTYDLVTHTGANALDYNNINSEPIKNAVVELVCEGGVASTTNTDMNGNYTLTAPSNISNVFVRVKAQMFSAGSPSYDFSVVDNTQSQSLYAMVSTAFNIATTNIVNKNLHAASGWSGAAYTSTRVAAPFAILDSVRLAMQEVINVEAAAIFAPLKLNWSVNNTTATGNTSLGQITSSHYDGTDIFILGAADNDTDEYDRHVIIHEWAHYFEDKFSRSDSVGGVHGGGDILDMRVAFGEGFGNAYSAIASSDVMYRDSNGVSQSSGFNFNLENNLCLNKGWYSECSVQSILYDLFDASNDGGQDMVGLGFEPIYDVLVGEQKNTKALTSIFSFITAYKIQNSGVSSDIDAIVSSQSIDVITDIYGDSESTNNPGSINQLPVFTQM
jgi:hypothetical protein